jgi:CDGSH-type Zn-finger protein
MVKAIVAAGSLGTSFNKAQSIMSSEEPVIAQKGPYKIELLADYRYAWCSCGLSKIQPFCDGSHTSTKTGMKPVVWTQDESKTVFLCGCKHSGKGQYCDGTHKSL